VKAVKIVEIVEVVKVVEIVRVRGLGPEVSIVLLRILSA
jgi:hypothetical protein